MPNHKFLIVTPSYTANSGGAIVLHKLCDVINSLGGEAYLAPFEDNYLLNNHNYLKTITTFLLRRLTNPLRPFKTNPKFKTQRLLSDTYELGPEWVVIYPETVFGNPLNAKKVVRWLLNNPSHDFETGEKNKPYFYGPNELYFRIGPWFNEFNYPHSKTSNSYLQVFSYPLDFYNENNASTKRKGSAYLVRKGVNKKIVHDLSDSICIDGLKHKEISDILKSVVYFYSYDSISTYSQLAVLCGAISIVIPDLNVSAESWMPIKQDRLGVAYGIHDIEFALSTATELKNYLKLYEDRNKVSVLNFFNEVDAYFK